MRRDLARPRSGDRNVHFREAAWRRGVHRDDHERDVWREGWPLLNPDDHDGYGPAGQVLLLNGTGVA